jgi:hypothetical protein
MFELAPCPVCGKQPKIKALEKLTGGSYIKIHCTPIFEKPHLEVILRSGRCCLYDDNYHEAAKRWNERVKTYGKSME